jgi:tetratricopeptide (TPR) repeat protein
MAAMKKVRSIILAVALAWVGACKHCSAGEPTAEKLMAEAYRASHRHETDKAISLYERALAMQPRNADACFNLALLYDWQKANYHRADQVIQKALSIRPSEFDFRWEQAMIRLAQDRDSEGLKLLKSMEQHQYKPAQQARLKKKIAELEHAGVR